MDYLIIGNILDIENKTKHKMQGLQMQMQILQGFDQVHPTS